MRDTLRNSSADTGQAYTLDAAAVAGGLETMAETGLSGVEAARRLQIHGPNRLKAHKPQSLTALLVHQFKSIIVWLLVAAAVLSLALGDRADAIAICVVLLINGIIGFVTELRAARSMEALLRITDVSARVRRDGQVREISAVEIVPGDIVLLEAGDVVSADLRLFSVSGLLCDESLLSGESAPVAKDIHPLKPDTSPAERSNMAFSGTAVTQGLGEGIAVATGMASELGRIGALAQEADGQASPLEQRLDRLGHRLLWLTLVLAAVTSLAGVLWGHPLADMLKTGVALAVAAIPEGLPVVATLCLARGMWRMATHHALVTRLSAVETLGSTTIILTDKTGTLTENRMSVVRYLLADTDITVTQTGTGNGPGFLRGGLDLNPAETALLIQALETGALCNTADLGSTENPGTIGDPMEISLLQAAKAAGVAHPELGLRLPQAARHAFDPGCKMMATVHEHEGRYLYAVKGAPEAVLAVATRVMTEAGEKPLTSDHRAIWRARQAEAASSGLRLLALASKVESSASAAPYADLTLIAFVCFLDPLRAGIPQAVHEAQRAGVRVVMITGDHPQTGARIARDAGIGAGELKVMTGREVEAMGSGSAQGGTGDQALLTRTDVFARVAPETKYALVSAFQNAGHVVAMTGDGVNDAPALKKADIGIAMGQRGTQVAREAASIVLQDDNFATILMAMRQGRIIFENIRKFVVYLMSCNVSEVLIVGLAVGIGLPVPLLPLQILFLNLVTDVFPAFALGLGRGSADVMQRPPRDPKEPIIDRPRWILIGILGSAITLAVLAAFTLALFWLELPAGPSVTVTFLTLALAQLWNVFNMCSPCGRLSGNDVLTNTYVWGALALCLGLIAAALWHPGLSQILGLEWPGLNGLLLSGTLSFVPLVMGQVFLMLMPDPARLPPSASL
ncbi:cation-translocating P-type ATPase [Roseibium litorale]|uniref:Cation-transporting P-type ATPase n=1 Tax=Roseibium litorale TaxID=2803841 RepID=A0ABR9CKX5_9HYPH|nr:cation-transporting P-type ATPase [Roseibium litorale]MBD8891309.1 cation-transporting P-type ATPase [Roseibium litorale]